MSLRRRQWKYPKDYSSLETKEILNVTLNVALREKSIAAALVDAIAAVHSKQMQWHLMWLAMQSQFLDVMKRVSDSSGKSAALAAAFETGYAFSCPPFPHSLRTGIVVATLRKIAVVALQGKWRWVCHSNAMGAAAQNPVCGKTKNPHLDLKAMGSMWRLSS